MSEFSIKLINRETLVAQRARLLEALAETEEILKALGWEAESESTDLPVVKAIRPRRRARIELPAVKVSLREAVLAACQEIKNDITRSAVIAHIRAAHPEMEIKDASVGATLSNLKSDNEIVEVEHGSGGKPSVFRVP